MARDLSRQSFLGADSAATIGRMRVGIVGLCGGGSHVAQQLAHVGIGRFVLCDPDVVEESNLNRMVGATVLDAAGSRNKVDVIADRVLAINPEAELVRCIGPWQQHALALRGVDAVFGCVDSYSERSQLEAMCRRFLIPYIDVGMDVSECDGRYVISGQVIVSLPGYPCMRCMGFLTDDLLSTEAQRYGAAGGRPQVVWPNGVLASTAVAKFMSLMLPWQAEPIPLFSEYDGNSHRVFPSNRLQIIRSEGCCHFDGPGDIGDPFY